MTEDRDDTGIDSLAEDVEKDPQTGRYCLTWDETDSIVALVVRAIAAVSGREPAVLPSLAHVGDPDALERVAHSLWERDAGVLCFTYAGYAVRIRSDGQLILVPEGDGETATDRE